MPTNQIFDLSPLTSLTDLTALNLQSNQIIDVSALSGLLNLHYLYLDSNQIVSISSLITNAVAGGLGSGDTVTLVNNPLNAAGLTDAQALIGTYGASVTY